MQIRDWQINAAIVVLACGSFGIGAKYAASTAVDQQVTIEDTASYVLIQEPLARIKQCVINRDVREIQKYVQGNGFEMSKDDYKEFLNQFKTQGDITLFINELENQAAAFVKGSDLSDRYYYLDGDVDSLVLRVNKVKVNARFGTSNMVTVNGVDYDARTRRIVELPEVLPFNTKFRAEVGGKWKEEQELKLFDMFIGKQVKVGSDLTAKLKFYKYGAGNVVFIRTNRNNAIIYVNDKKTDRTVSSGGCFRDGFEEGDTIRLEYGGKKSKEYKVDKNNLTTTLNINFTPFLPPKEVKPEVVTPDYNAIANTFLSAITSSISSGNTTPVEGVMVSEYRYVARNALQPLLIQYTDMQFSDVYVSNTVLAGDGSRTITVTYNCSCTDASGGSVVSNGIATLNLNSAGGIVGFTLQ